MNEPPKPQLDNFRDPECDGGEKAFKATLCQIAKAPKQIKPKGVECE